MSNEFDIELIFSLEEGATKKGILDFGKNASDGTKKGCEQPIILNNEYDINWKKYSEIDNTNTGTFMYLVNKIEK